MWVVLVGFHDALWKLHAQAKAESHKPHLVSPLATPLGYGIGYECQDKSHRVFSSNPFASVVSVKSSAC